MDVTVLRRSRGPFFSDADRSSYDRLLEEVLDRKPLLSADLADPWVPIACFDPAGACVANVDVAVLPMIGDDRPGHISAVRSVAVAPTWRGLGLFGSLMREALTWCDARAPATILYTAEPALYSRYGFSTVPQHAFLLSKPELRPAGSLRILDLDASADRTLLIRYATQRSWLSTRAALAIDPATFLRNASDPDLTIAYAEHLDAVVIYDMSDGTLTLTDVLAERMPRLDQIVGAMPAQFSVIRTRFPPDQLGFAGKPEPDDTGLMLRGLRPEGWARPFTIAPTAEF